MENPFYDPTTPAVSKNVTYTTTPGKVEVRQMETRATADGLVTTTGVNTQTVQPNPAKKKKDCNFATCGNNGFCLPFIIYLILSVIILLGFFFSRRSPMETVAFTLLEILWIVLIGFLIYWLCKHGHVGWAWFVLILPLIIQLIWVVLSWLFPQSY